MGRQGPQHFQSMSGGALGLGVKQQHVLSAGVRQTEAVATQLDLGQICGPPLDAKPDPLNITITWDWLAPP
jgi:hypothetical protein